jgi:membrane protein implicated in regulation of membrane protease activity
MNWELFYLICFIVGFTFSVLSFFGGLHRFHLHVHLPKHMHLGGMGHGAGHSVGHANGTGHSAKGGGGHFPLVSPLTMASFLTWFGGTGYLLVHLRHVWVFAGLALSSLVGLVAASVVFVMVAKILLANDQDTDPMEYEMVGVLGRVSVTIRPDGTGEIIFEQTGVRKPCAARSDQGGQLAKGEEVVVTRYERGVAYVRRWDEMANPREISPEEKTTS